MDKIELRSGRDSENHILGRQNEEGEKEQNDKDKSHQKAANIELFSKRREVRWRRRQKEIWLKTWK